MAWRRIILIAFIFITWPAINCFATTYTWIGGNGDWNNANNWLHNVIFTGIPGSSDAVVIASGNITLSTASAQCGSIEFGTGGISLTVSAGLKLQVNGSIMQDVPTLLQNVTTTLAGAGTISCTGVQIGNGNVFLLGTGLLANVVQLVSQVNNFTISGDVNINSTSDIIAILNIINCNALLSIQGGTTTISGTVLTKSYYLDILNLLGSITPTVYSKLSLDVPTGSALNPTLKLTGPTPISASSNAASIDFYNNTGGTGICTVIYAGTSAQPVYTEGNAFLDKSPAAYQNITFTGNTQKTVQPGNLSIAGNWISTQGKVDAVSNNPTVIFKSAVAQTLSDTSSDSGNGIAFKNVNFRGGNTKTMTTGKFAVITTGVLTMGNSTTLSNNGNLSLLSDSLSTATVATVPTGSFITGKVNVQRFIQGSWVNASKRGYRLISSTVYTGSVTTPQKNNVFDVTYLLNNTYLSGPVGGGFNAPNGTNPTAYLFREDVVPSNNGFTAGNWKGIDKMNNTPVYNIGTQARLTKANVADTTAVLPVGNGLLFFFIGNQSNNSSQSGSKTSPPFDYPESVTFTQVGSLNTGTINVRLWFRPDSLLSYTNLGGNAGVQGFCLVGNPYASTINWEKFNRSSTLSNSSIYGSNFPAASATPATIWVFNQSSKQYDTYQQKTGTVDTTTVRPSSNYTGSASNMIASGQGFFIKATATNQYLSFRETAKTSTQPTASGLDSVFIAQKPTAMAQVPELPDPALRFKLLKDSVNTDEIVISFAKNASANFDAMDAEDMGGIGAQVSLSALSADSVKLAINSIPLPSGTASSTIPLFVSATTSGAYKLDLVNATNLPKSCEVWLRDNLQKDSVDVRSNPDYSFNIDLTNAASFGSNRFCVIIRENPAYITKLTTFNATKVAASAVLTWTTTGSDSTIFMVQRSTDNGKTFTTLNTIRSGAQSDYMYIDNSPAKGIDLYHLAYLTDGQQEYSTTIPLDFSATADVAITLYPNPTTSMINLKINNNQSNDYTIMLLNTSGAVINKVNTATTNWQYNASNLYPGAYLITVYDNKEELPVGTSKFIKQ